MRCKLCQYNTFILWIHDYRFSFLFLFLTMDDAEGICFWVYKFKSCMHYYLSNAYVMETKCFLSTNFNSLFRSAFGNSFFFFNYLLFFGVHEWKQNKIAHEFELQKRQFDTIHANIKRASVHRYFFASALLLVLEYEEGHCNWKILETKKVLLNGESWKIILK